MNPESLILHLEKIVHSVREDPMFPWSTGTLQLIAKVNAGSESLGFLAPIAFDWNPEEGVAQFGVRPWDSSIPSLPPLAGPVPSTIKLLNAECVSISLWRVPEFRLQNGDVRLHPSGRAKRDCAAAPLRQKDRAGFAQLLEHWVLIFRNAALEPAGPRFAEPAVGLGEKAHAVRQILLEHYPAAVRGPKLVRLLDRQGLDETESNISGRIMRELRKAGCDVRNDGRGYYLVPVDGLARP